jgi:hypothetical protein
MSQDKIQGNLYWYGYPSPEGMVVGARVGVALGVSNVGDGRGSVGMSEGSYYGSSVGFDI